MDITSIAALKQANIYHTKNEDALPFVYQKFREIVLIEKSTTEIQFS